MIIVLVGVGSHASAQVTSTVSDGGSYRLQLSSDIKVNKGSTLHRSLVALNDAAAPLQLVSSGISTSDSHGDRAYRYTATGKVTASSAVTALEVRFLLYDAFGNHMKTLSSTEVTDLAAGSELALKGIASWRAFENEVSELLTTVAFVASVRTADGKVWRHNEKTIATELSRIQLQVKSGVLDATKQQ